MTMGNALGNKFKTISQVDSYYAQRLQERTREREINKNLNEANNPKASICCT